MFKAPRGILSGRNCKYFCALECPHDCRCSVYYCRFTLNYCIKYKKKELKKKSNELFHEWIKKSRVWNVLSSPRLCSCSRGVLQCGDDRFASLKRWKRPANNSGLKSMSNKYKFHKTRESSWPLMVKASPLWIICGWMVFWFLQVKWREN